MPYCNKLVHGRGGREVPHLGHEKRTPLARDLAVAQNVAVSTFLGSVRRIRKKFGGEAVRTAIRAVTIADIDKALKPKEKKIEAELREEIPKEFHDILELWSADKAAKLPPHRGPGVDHSIPIKRDDKGNELPLPWGPLYNMSRDELLVLRKTLTDLLDKGYIRASSSEAGAPVLFVRKPGGGIRFCCDYRALNAITKADRYPLPLIGDTLRNLTKAKWFTKLDVVSAFHKIRIADGEEGKTAFRTRYGLFEWIVTPFGLSGAPATFQRYINSTLREFLDDFAIAFADDVLIYSSGSRKDHMCKVRKVLDRLL